MAIPDEVAAEGMRVLGKPLGADPKVIFWESGASTTGFVYAVLSTPGPAKLKEMLGLNEDSRIPCFSTEGDTDKENYRRIVGE